MVIPRIQASVIMFHPENLPGGGGAEVYKQLADPQGDVVSYFFGLSTVFG
jgi:hypothetical protein